MPKHLIAVLSHCLLPLTLCTALTMCSCSSGGLNLSINSENPDHSEISNDVNNANDANESDESDDGVPFEWEISDNTLTISGTGNIPDYEYDVADAAHSPWHGEDFDIVVIDPGIKQIGDGAFYQCNVKSIVIPNSVTRIGSGAFSECKNLESIVIPGSVTSIGGRAFSDCDKLKSVTIPNTTKFIGWKAFYRCKSLENIEISESVETLGLYAFHGTAWYQNQSDGLIYIHDMVYAYKGSMPTGTEITLRDGVTYIACGAFENCYNLKSITMPDSVKTIEAAAFYGCARLEKAVIPDSVEYIGVRAFYDCKYLQDVTIPESVTSVGNDAFHGTAWYKNQPDGPIYIGKVLYKYKGDMPENTEITVRNDTTAICGYAFENAYNLKSIVIPNKTADIGVRAFSGCRNLKSITLPNSLTRIENGTFYECESLESITIPNSVTSIGSEAFSFCESLKSITIPESVTSVGVEAFWDTAWYEDQPDGLIYIGKVLYRYKGDMPENTEIIVRDGTVSITGYVFSRCENLKSVFIPDSVTQIGENAFRSHTSLTDIYYEGTEKQWNRIESNLASELSEADGVTVHFSSQP